LLKFNILKRYDGVSVLFNTLGLAFKCNENSDYLSLTDYI
jgi:hypothetical protein